MTRFLTGRNGKLTNVPAEVGKITKPKLTKIQQLALNYFELDFAQSDEVGAGWFAYTSEITLTSYPGSSCECIEDVVTWYAEIAEK